MKHYLCSASIVKNEQKYIKDFLFYNKWMGIEHFYLFDRSTPSIREQTQDLDWVTVIDFPAEKVHVDAWKAAVDMLRGQTTWLALFDIDQFFVSKTGQKLPEILKPYETSGATGAVGVNWQTFGSNGYVNEPSCSQFRAFTKAANWLEGVNTHIQSIVLPEHINTNVYRFPDPHNPQHFLNGKCNINMNWGHVPGPFNSPPLHDKLYLAHFITRSKEEWNFKRSKGRADILNVEREDKEFNDLNSYCNNIDCYDVKNIYEEMVKSGFYTSDKDK